MQIQSNSSILNNNIPFKKGLYFAKTPYIYYLIKKLLLIILPMKNLNITFLIAKF